MASAPASEFLTFYRRVATSSTIRHQLARPLSSRPFSSSVSRYSSGGKLSTDDSVNTAQFGDKEHTTDKKDTLDVQSSASKAGQQAQSQGGGGNATSQTGAKSTEKAKREHPEAPDVVIGMQDERGGKGC